MREMGPVNWKELKEYIRADLAYVNGKPIRSFLERYFFEAGFKFSVWLRLTRYFYLRKSILFVPARFILKHYSYKYSFDISYRAQIGPGLTIAHFGYIIVPSYVYIGDCCTLRPGVVFGKKLSKEENHITIGNKVSFGVGSKVIGSVLIGDNVLVGANAVVVGDVPSDVIVAGVPAKIVNTRQVD